MNLPFRQIKHTPDANTSFPLSRSSDWMLEYALIAFANDGECRIHKFSLPLLGGQMRLGMQMQAGSGTFLEGETVRQLAELIY